MRWHLPQLEPGLSRRLAEDLNLPHKAGDFLQARGLKSAEDAARFLNLDLKALPDPARLGGLSEAAERLMLAHRRRELVAVCGDYDADGLTSAALLTSVLKGLGHEVTTRIPHRLTEGYGFTPQAVEDLAAQGAKLAITVDCGVSDARSVALARRAGIDVIVTDHHKLPPQLPEAVAVINPRQAGSFEHPELAGVGVAFFVAGRLRRIYREAGLIAAANLPPLAEHLALVALGTVADVSPLTGVNRILVHHGLSHLSRPKSYGLPALKEAAGFEATAPVTPKDIGFRLAPRLNAAGRLGPATPALDLLLADNQALARQKANELEQLNRRRCELQNRTIGEALEMAELELSPENRTIVFASPGWPRGIVGLAASRLSEKMHRPTILLTLENGLAVGSGRSRPGFNLYEALNGLRDMFHHFGGHEQAAGLTLDAENLPDFKKAFEKAAREQPEPEMEDHLYFDLEAEGLPDLVDLAEPLSSLGPFGAGYVEPVALVRNLKAVSARVAGRGNHHLKLVITDADGFRHTLWGFGMADRQAELGPHLDLAVKLDISEYQGRLNANWHLVDFKAHSC